MNVARSAFLIGGCIIACGIARATEIVYTPNNPSFGGNPANGVVLLNSAQAQDKLKDPSLSSSGGALAPDALAQQLQSIAFSNLTSKISAGSLTSGTFRIGTSIITLTPIGGGNTRVSITDTATGATTVVDITPF